MPRALFVNVNITVSACLCENWQVNIVSAMNNFKPPGAVKVRNQHSYPKSRLQPIQFNS